jgi:hypothetical protein
VTVLTLFIRLFNDALSTKEVVQCRMGLLGVWPVTMNIEEATVVYIKRTDL